MSVPAGGASGGRGAGGRARPGGGGPTPRERAPPAGEIVPGFAFSEDTVWQQEVEGAFPYVETPDQLEVQQQVKEDMEATKPMDRLVCVDVGYGKTEVAIRA